MLRIALVVALLAVPLAAEEPPTPVAEQHTTVRGKPPDELIGRWIAIGTLDLPNEKKRAVPYFWEIARQNGELALKIHFVWAPDAQKEAMRAANREGRVWKPSPEDLKAFREGWDTMKAWDGVPRVDVELRGPGATKAGAETLWDATILYTFNHPRGGNVHQSNDYTARSVEEGTWAGPFRTTVDLPAGTRPEGNVTAQTHMDGSFALYRLDPPARGVLSRLGDFFAGCKR